MTSADYSKWSADDSSVIEFIKQKLGFSDIPVEPVSEEPVPQESVEEPVPQEEPQTDL
jgi:hypothetical protein